MCRVLGEQSLVHEIEIPKVIQGTRERVKEWTLTINFFIKIKIKTFFFKFSRLN